MDHKWTRSGHLGDIPGLGLSAEHGCFLRKPYAAKDDWINLTENLDMSWQKDVLDIFEYYTERTIGIYPYMLD
jgi:trehalose 6-phosphate synthase/phosphatase